MQTRVGQTREDGTHLIAGGAPAGINILPGESGCLTKMIKMRMTTMRGKSITTPRGIEMAEFPLRRSGLRKNSRRDFHDFVLGLSSFSSAVGSRGGRCNAFPARRIRSIADGVASASTARDLSISAVEVGEVGC